MNSWAVFSDFDGTITATETFAVMMRKFAPELSAELVPRMMARELSLRVGVRQILEAIPSKAFPGVLEQVRQAPLRPGLVEFMDFLDERGVPLVVVSGGLADMVAAAMGDLLQRAHAVHAINIDTSGPTLGVQSDFEDGDELVAKVRVMEKYPSERSVSIGDSVTDIHMSEKADIVFARDRLTGYLTDLGVSFIPWNDWHDVRTTLEKLWDA